MSNLPPGEAEIATLRFSNFGNMVALSGEEDVAPDVLREIKELLVQQGYTYVPSAVLKQPYTKEEGQKVGIHSWWIRSFDWL